jgi:hypothetical protein
VNIKRRIERAEETTGAGVCPCRRPARIEIVEAPKGERVDAGPCSLCGEALPVRVIEAVRPEGGRL